MNSAHLVKEFNFNHILTSVCCNIKNENCLIRKCQICKNKSVEFNPCENNKIIYWKQWVTEKEKKISEKTNKEIIVSRTFKKIYNGSVQDVK